MALMVEEEDEKEKIYTQKIGVVRSNGILQLKGAMSV